VAVVQEAILRALRSLDRFEWRGDDSFLRWVSTIAEHLLRDSVDRERRRTSARLEEQTPGDDPSPSRGARREERVERLKEAIRVLPEEYREVVVLARVDGWDDTEPREAELLWRYLDPLNAGDELDFEEIRREHPDVGEEIVAQIEAFQRLTAEPSADEPLGTLGDYTLRRRIGRGGMGVVYEAWEGSMNRAVALKVLPVAIANDEKAMVRFVREAQVAGRLQHPNVVSVFGMGVRGESPCYAMEYVEGKTLAEILQSRREEETPFGRRDELAYFSNLASAFGAVADGLQHAHAHGVTHRDIKPSNLILDLEGRLRILDFGLARLEGQDSLTLSNDVVGTPLYMSPEQVQRTKAPVGPQSDIYSLGATLFQSVTGQPPFRVGRRVWRRRGQAISLVGLLTIANAAIVIRGNLSEDERRSSEEAYESSVRAASLLLTRGKTLREASVGPTWTESMIPMTPREFIDLVTARANAGAAQFDDVRERIEQARSLPPDRPEAHFYLGRFELLHGRTDRAVEHLSRAGSF